ncbi:MAG: hypothetical protein ACFFBP_19245, partial [Promethearchaeota archaeon]
NMELSPEIMEEARKRISWVQYKGKEIEIDDFTNLSGDEFVRLIRANAEITLKMGKKNILAIVDFTNSYANKDVMDALKETSEKTEHLLDKTAVLGITGVKKILLNFLNKVTNIGAKSFNSIEDAKEWLIS